MASRRHAHRIPDVKPERVNLIDGIEGYGEGGLVLETVTVSDEAGVSRLEQEHGKILRIAMTAVARRVVRKPNLGFILTDLDGVILFGISLKNLTALRGHVEAGERISARFAMRCDLMPGTYWLTAIAGDNHQSVSDDSGVHHDTRERIGPLRIMDRGSGQGFMGRIQLPHTVDWQTQ